MSLFAGRERLHVFPDVELHRRPAVAEQVVGGADARRHVVPVDAFSRAGGIARSRVGISG